MKKLFVRVTSALTLYAALSSIWLATAGCGTFSTYASSNESSSSVTVNEAKTIGTLPPDFVGLSYEGSELAHGFNTTGNLVALLKTLSQNRQGNLRIGGNSVDRKVFWQPGSQPVPTWARVVVTPADINQLAAFAKAADWHVELAVNLGHLDVSSIVSETEIAAPSLGSQLKAIECGNEPNDFAGSLRPKPYTYLEYKADFTTCANAIGNKAPIAGPDTTGAFITQFIQDEHSRVSMITQHAYTLNHCGKGKTKIWIATDLLSSTRDSEEISKITDMLKTASAQHLSLRLDETNSVNCSGLSGISNTYASSLWAVNYMLLMAQQGIAGVNFHGGLSQCQAGTYTPLCATSAANLKGNIFTAQPIYYGILLASLIGPGQFLPVTVSTSSNITAYAIRGSDGKTRVIIVEKDDTSGGLVNITLKDGNKSGTAQVLNLTGTSLASSQGVAIQGATVDQNGNFTPRTPDQIQGQSGSYTIPLKSGSAALITLP